MRIDKFKTACLKIRESNLETCPAKTQDLLTKARGMTPNEEDDSGS